MKQVDEIFYEAIQADQDIMTATGGRVKSTCFEIPPYEDDNTPVPFIIINDDGFQNIEVTKDSVWESAEDRVQVSVEVDAASPSEVKTLIRKVRRAIEDYICTTYTNGGDIPVLESLTSDGLAWDWEKPCYFQRLIYQCIIPADTDEEKENIEI